MPFMMPYKILKSARSTHLVELVVPLLCIYTQDEDFMPNMENKYDSDKQNKRKRELSEGDHDEEDESESEYESESVELVSEDDFSLGQYQQATANDTDNEP